MALLGLDPGLLTTGYAVIEPASPTVRIIEAGVIKPTGKPLEERVASLYDSVVELIAAHKPESVAIEQLYAHYDHPRTAILMGHARGVLLLAAAKQGLAVESYAATRIKKTITGHGRASKLQMQLAIQRELGLKTMPEPADVADALAVALCHYYAMKAKR